MTVTATTTALCYDIDGNRRAQRRAQRRAVLALSCLVLQNSAVIIFTRFTFRVGAPAYNKATVVLSAELLKLVACILTEFRAKNGSFRKVRSSMTFTWSNLTMAIPASLYVLQNSLQLRALQGLSPGLFATMSQLKIASSAVFNYVLVGRPLTKMQIASIPILLTGVLTTQLRRESALSQDVKHMYFGAVIALLVAVTISGFAGSFLEWSYNQKGESIWIKNAYLSIFSLPSALFMLNSTSVLLSDFFNGYDIFVVIVVVLLAWGGLLTALVMKHAGNLTKCYAVSLSIVICNVVSFKSDSQQLDSTLLCGILLVMLGVVMYTQ